MYVPAITGTALTLLASLAGAQEIPPSKLYPVTVPVRSAGVLDLATGAWNRSGSPDGSSASSAVVYDNTCSWTGGSFYFGPEDCEEVYDSGRVPSSTDPNAPAGATDDNLIDCFEISYCTAFATGSVSIQIALYEQLGPCVSTGGKPPGNGELAYFDLAGMGLPGDNTGSGLLACWTVSINVPGGGVCMRSDGDGVWDGSANLDNFGWSFGHDMDNALTGFASGPLIRADPTVSAFGSCTYTIPCGVDPSTGTACGTGLGVADQYYGNTDGSASGSPGGALCPGSIGTNCYWFGGAPVNPFASFHFKLQSAGPCATGNCAQVYCSNLQNPSTGNCVATIRGAGCQPSSGAGDYDVVLTGAENNKPVALIFGTNGRATTPFSNGTLCVAGPTKLSPRSNTGAAGGPCTGTNRITVNDPAGIDFAAGTQANFQYWIRDRASASGTDLSDGLEVIYQ